MMEVLVNGNIEWLGENKIAVVYDNNSQNNINANIQ